MKKIPKCSPETETRETCEFSGEPLYNLSELNTYYPKLYQEMMIDLDLDNPETLDFLEEFDFYILKEGTTIVHTTTIELKKENNKYYYRDSINWWKNYYPGQKDYKGGWFTYKTSFGGPHFNTELFYKVERDIPLIYIPNFYRNDFLKTCGNKSDEENTSDFYDCKYYKENKKEIKKLIDLDKFNEITNLTTEEYLTYDNLYSLVRWQSSHLIPGVKNWKKKGYKMITHLPTEYADDLALRLSNLGFYGYISCDECEIYLTHKIMKDSLNRPYQYQIIQFSPLEKYILEYIIDNDNNPESKLKVTSESTRTSGKYDFVEVPDDIVQDALSMYRIINLKH